MDPYTLREFRADDAGSIREYMNDVEFCRYLDPGFPHPFEDEDAERFVQGCLGQEWSFVIVVDGDPVGSVHLGEDPVKPIAELACLIGTRQQSKGLGFRVCSEVIDRAFQRLALEKIFARAHCDNLASINVMSKLGMKHEGRIRSCRLDRSGGLVDEVHYGLLRDEWMTRKSPSPD